MSEALVFGRMGPPRTTLFEGSVLAGSDVICIATLLHQCVPLWRKRRFPRNASFDTDPIEALDAMIDDVGVLRLAFREREEISRGIAQGVSLRCLARRLGRSPSTVSREVAGNGGRAAYRAAVAHTASRRRAHRPKPSKLAGNPQLRQVVEAKLGLWWSPLQISRWLTEEYAGDEEMRVSHETIYQSLFIQGKGALRRELWRCLRTLSSQGESGVDLANRSSWSGR